jgi:hypothetical protein
MFLRCLNYARDFKILYAAIREAFPLYTHCLKRFKVYRSDFLRLGLLCLVRVCVHGRDDVFLFQKMTNRIPPHRNVVNQEILDSEVPLLTGYDFRTSTSLATALNSQARVMHNANDLDVLKF